MIVSGADRRFRCGDRILWKRMAHLRCAWVCRGRRGLIVDTTHQQFWAAGNGTSSRRGCHLACERGRCGRDNRGSAVAVVVFQSARSKTAPAELTGVGGSAGDYRRISYKKSLVGDESNLQCVAISFHPSLCSSFSCLSKISS